MSAYDEEYPLDSFLEMEEPAPRRWLIGLVSITGLAAFVGVGWYLYQPDIDAVPGPPAQVVFASAAAVVADPAVDVTVSIDDGTTTISVDAGTATVTADAGAVTVANTVAPIGDFGVASTEVGAAAPIERPAAIAVQSRVAGPVEERAMVIEPAALLTNSDEVDNLSVTSLVQPKHGSLVANGDGTFTYKPDAGYAGVDSFSYTVTVYHALGSPQSEPKPERISPPSVLPEPSDPTPVHAADDANPPAKIRLAANLVAVTRMIDADMFARVVAPSADAPVDHSADPSADRSADPAADQPPPQANPANGQFAAQFAAFRSAASAERAWQALQRKHPDILAGTDYRVQTIDLGSEKGIFHRLQAIGFATRTAAIDVCERLKARQQVCFVIPR